MLDDPWRDLMDALNSWAAARELAGAIEATSFAPSGERRVVEIIMTREDWEEMADNIGTESSGSVIGHLMTLAADEHFLDTDSSVELVPSPTRELLADGLAPEPGGQWVATDDAGNTVSRFAEWNGVAD